MKFAWFCKFFIAFYPLFVLPYQKVIAQAKAVYSQIIIEYGKGHNSWGDIGLYSRTEVITIVPTNTGKYKITGHLNILSHANPARYWKDTIKRKTAKYKLIDAAVIDSLLKQLSTTKQNFTYSFIRPKLTPPSQKQVVKLAKVLDVYYKLKDEDDDDTKKVVTKLRRFDKLDSFINAHKPTTDALVLVDAWNY